MRKQYHSRFVDGRRFIWDVHRLVELARPLPVTEIRLADIAELDESYWFENTVPTCRSIAAHCKLILETDLSHAISLAADGRVMDGMHRVCKALVEGRTKLSAVRFPFDPEPDFIDMDLEKLPYDEGNA